MSFRNAATVVVARIFELLDNMGFTRITFGQVDLDKPIATRLGWGLDWHSPQYVGDASAHVAFSDNPTSATPPVIAQIRTMADDADNFTRLRLRNTVGFDGSEGELQARSEGEQASITLRADDALSPKTTVLLTSTSGRIIATATQDITLNGPIYDVWGGRLDRYQGISGSKIDSAGWSTVIANFARMGPNLYIALLITRTGSTVIASLDAGLTITTLTAAPLGTLASTSLQVTAAVSGVTDTFFGSAVTYEPTSGRIQLRATATGWATNASAYFTGVVPFLS